jgi:hypothetical protein
VQATTPDIRLANRDDADVVADLLVAFRDWFGKSEPATVEIRASVERIMGDGDGEYLLAFLGEEPVGVCQLRYRWSVWTSSPDCWLEDLFVAEEARGTGLGRALMEAALERARERGCGRIELDVNEQNEPALGLYVASGFELEWKPPGRSILIGRRLAG